MGDVWLDLHVETVADAAVVKLLAADRYSSVFHWHASLLAADTM